MEFSLTGRTFWLHGSWPSVKAAIFCAHYRTKVRAIWLLKESEFLRYILKRIVRFFITLRLLPLGQSHFLARRGFIGNLVE